MDEWVGGWVDMHRNHLAAVFPTSASLACAIWLFCWKTRPEREQGLYHWLCFQPLGISCSHHMSLAWTQKVETSFTLTPSLPALAFALCLLPPLKGLGGGRTRAINRKTRKNSSLFFFSKQVFFSPPSCCHFTLHRP